jgi:hypothetical protein
MFNLKKLMRIVKKGISFGNAFNISKQAVYRGTGEDIGLTEQKEKNIYEESDRLEEDMGTQWLAQQGVSVEPSDIPVQMAPVPEDVPDVVEDRMNMWLKENFKDINNEEISAVTADPGLYRELVSHPEYVQILSDKIKVNHSGLTDAQSDLFVETMMARTQDLMGSIEEREREMEEEDALKSQQTIELPETGLGQKLYNKIVNLTPEENQVFKDQMMMGYTSQMLSDAVSNHFDAPPGSRIDQRMNFFLSNPVFLEDIFQADPDFAQRYQQYDSKFQKIDLLKQEKGDFLLSVLDRLIDILDPSVVNWLKRGFPYQGRAKGQNVREQSQTDIMPETDDGKTSELGGLDPIEQAPLATTGADEGESSKFISDATKYYLTDNINEMRVLNQISSTAMMEEGKNKYMYSSEGSLDQARALKQYGAAEKLNAYFLAVASQLKDLFDVRGNPLTRDITQLVYRNPEGKAVMDVDVMKRMMNIGERSREMAEQEGEQEGYKEVSDYTNYIDEYKNRIKSGDEKEPFSPKWKEMINYNLVMRSFAELGEIKSKILDLKKRKHTDPASFIAPLTGGGGLGLLEHFSGVDANDTEETKNKKMSDFIYMTLKQDPALKKDPKGYSLKAPLQAYEDTKVIDGLQREIEQDKESLSFKYNQNKQDSIRSKEQEINSMRREMGKNFKSLIGTSYIPILGPLADQVDEKVVDPKTGVLKNKFSQGALFGFVELFDHNPTKMQNFIGLGQQKNRYDDPLYRTNTELYYKIRGTEPPEHVKSMIGAYTEGKETGALSKDEWYKDVFDTYRQFDVYQRSYAKQKERLDKVQEGLSSRISKANDKIVNKIESGEIDLENIRDRIKDPAKQMEFEEKMNSWDKASALPSDYYADYFGLAKTEKMILQDKKKIKTLQQGVPKEEKKRKTERAGEGEGTKDLLVKFKENKTRLEQIFEDRGKKIDLSALKIAESMYRIVQNRLLKLSEIKKSSYKFAFINIGSVDDIIKEVKRDFDDFFDNLFE